MPISRTDPFIMTNNLYDPPLSLWWLDGGTKTVACRVTNYNWDGSVSVVTGSGMVSIYRPKMTRFIAVGPFTPMISGGWLELGNGVVGEMTFSAKVVSQTNFPGVINWTQLINRDTSIIGQSTSGFWLDNDPLYNTVGGVRGARPDNITVNPKGILKFSDNPGVTSGPYIRCTDSFNTYLVFLPDPLYGNASIWATLGIVNWGWSGTDIGGGLFYTNVVVPTYSDSTSFPTWPHTIHGTGH